MVDVSIIIVSFNTKKLLKNCLDSVIRQTKQIKYEIIVIDNASDDGSIEYVKHYYPQITCISNQKNVGFAKANNLGVAKAQGQYVLLLNSDTEIIDDAISLLFQKTQAKNQNITSCQLVNPDNTIQPQGGNLPNLISLFSWSWFLDDLPWIGIFFPSYQDQYPQHFENDHQVGWLGGTALLVRKSTYQRLSGLDEKIFMYAEDVDFCLRARQIDITCNYYYQPQIIHKGQGSSDKTGSLIGEYKGLYYLVNKHFHGIYKQTLKFIIKSGAFLRLFIFGMILKDEKRKTAYQQIIALG